VARTKDDHNRYYVSLWQYKLSTQKNPDLTEEIKRKISEENWGDLLKGEMYYCLAWAYQNIDTKAALKYYNVALDIFIKIKVEPQIQKVKKQIKYLEELQFEKLKDA